MKKFSILLSTLVLISILLAACGADQPNQTPGVDTPAVTLEATGTADTGMETETPSAGAGTTTPGVPVTGGEESSARLSNQLDYGVWNQNGEQIGDVNDMVIDLDNTRISYVIVGVGGFLGLGEKDVLVPWESLTLQPDNGAGSGPAFIFEGDQENFANAPDWDVDSMLPVVGEPAGDWDDEIRNFWATGALPATPDPAATGTTPADATATPDAGQGQVQPKDLQGVMLASDVLGSTIVMNQGQGQNDNQGQVQVTGTPDAMGTGTPAVGQPEPGRDQFTASIDDVIVDPETGELLYLVLDGLFDDGERWIPIPLGFLQWDPANENFVVKVDMAALQNAPFFLEGQYPDISVEGWSDAFDEFWANPEAGAPQATPTP
jgi:sporulation protein YlmC with PRC-barrel domain